MHTPVSALRAGGCRDCRLRFYVLHGGYRTERDSLRGVTEWAGSLARGGITGRDPGDVGPGMRVECRDGCLMVGADSTERRGFIGRDVDGRSERRTRASQWHADGGAATVHGDSGRRGHSADLHCGPVGSLNAAGSIVPDAVSTGRVNRPGVSEGSFRERMEPMGHPTDMPRRYANVPSRMVFDHTPTRCSGSL